MPGTEQNSYQRKEPCGPCVQSLWHRAPCTRKAGMSVHMGIMCERCRKVYFIAASRAIRPSEFAAGMYRLTCNLPCREVREFRKDGMRAYRVSEDVFRSGHAKEGEYVLVEVAKQPPKAGENSTMLRPERNQLPLPIRH